MVQGYAQTCDCPSQNVCNSCSGGMTRLKLKYIGNTSYQVKINDNGIIFETLLNPGNIFTINGGTQSGNFKSNEVEFYINGVLDVKLKTNCDLDFYPGIIYSNFVLLEAESKGGGKLCCTSTPSTTTPPVIRGCPQEIKVTSSSCSTIVNWAEPFAYDCDLVSFSSIPAVGSQFQAGTTTTVTYTARDFKNNITKCSFPVIVREGIAPTVTNCPSTITAVANASCKGIASWSPPTFTDNCDPVVIITSTHKPGDEFPYGVITKVKYTGTDDSGNTATCTFDVIVKDEESPIISDCPDNITVIADSSCKAKATWTAPTFSDNCSSSVTVISSHNSGAEFSIGTTRVTYTGTDDKGNKAICEFDVIVKDQIFCPNDIHLSTVDKRGLMVNWDSVETNDCGLIDVTSSPSSGALFPIGNTIVNYTATDNSGNITTCSFNVIIDYEVVELDISKVVTPDNNGINDQWVINNIDSFESNKVVIVDRWGSVIYSAENYNNQSVVWDGSNLNGTIVPTGTYFYSISFPSATSTPAKRGFIELIR